MPIHGHFRHFFFLSFPTEKRKMSEKRCQKWCLFIGYVSGILARIISPDSKKRSWFSNPRKLEYFVAVCFSSPAGRKRANEPVNPFTVGTCRASGGLQGGFPAEMPQSWKKGCSKCTLLEYPLVIINLFRGERGKLSAYMAVMQKIPCYFPCLHKITPQQLVKK